MSFLDRLKGRHPALADDAPAGSTLAAEGYGLRNPMEETVRLGTGTSARHSTLVDTRIDPHADTQVDTRIDGDAPTTRLSDSRLHDSSLIPDGSGAGAEAADPAGPEGGAPLPLIGRFGVAAQQRLLGGIFATALVALAAVAALALHGGRASDAQVEAAAEAQTQSQRMAKAAAMAVRGDAASFAELREGSTALARDVRALADAGVGGAAGLLPLAVRAEAGAGVLLAQERALVGAGQAVRTIDRVTAELLPEAEALAALKLQQGSTPAELAAAGQLVMLTQRIAREAEAIAGGDAGAAAQLARDLDGFRALAQGLADGNPELRLPGQRDPQQRERSVRLLQQAEALRAPAAVLLDNAAGLRSARAAQGALVADSEPLRRGLDEVRRGLDSRGGVAPLHTGLGVAAALVMLLAAWGLLRLFVHDQTQRSQLAERQRLEAERQELEAKRVNDANQAAILRLMNELQSVAEGDLTQQATVTEDITGAIADSVNYTVEELRTLVSQVQTTVARVAATTENVEQTSTELLAASTEQLREIRETGEAVLQMAGRINQVSSRAQRTAQVARQSLQVSATGLQSVQDTIGGMNAIRDQIQDTSKRIKRLGESSQEIGEITELISDITEQTNVLALNAAIQAASAGDAGRGFSVVAEEVQRLAERSGEATKQIAAIVRAIQADTQDAVAAMERSTQGVVEGARLSDAAGTALADIDRVTHQLSELIEQISAQALSEAEHANVVAGNIQHIFAVTEQTGEGTRSTAQMVRELSRTAEELRASVARFKVR